MISCEVGVDFEREKEKKENSEYDTWLWIHTSVLSSSLQKTWTAKSSGYPANVVKQRAWRNLQGSINRQLVIQFNEIRLIFSFETLTPKNYIQSIDSPVLLSMKWWCDQRGPLLEVKSSCRFVIVREDRDLLHSQCKDLRCCDQLVHNFSQCDYVPKDWDCNQLET